jgi:hypothetical protein
VTPQVRDFIKGIGVENIGKRLINSREGKVRGRGRRAAAALAQRRRLRAGGSTLAACGAARRCRRHPARLHPHPTPHTRIHNTQHTHAHTQHTHTPRHTTPQRTTQVDFEKPSMPLDILIKYGKYLVEEQDNVKRVQLADAYLAGAELAGTGGSSLPENYNR